MDEIANKFWELRLPSPTASRFLPGLIDVLLLAEQPTQPREAAADGISSPSKPSIFPHVQDTRQGTERFDFPQRRGRAEHRFSI